MIGRPERDEIAVVTGASTGIGAATAREMATRGFYVLAGVRRDGDADAIRAPGIEPIIIDITNPDHIRKLAQRVFNDPHGRKIRALVNNAGVGINAPVEVFPMNEWRRVLDVNLLGHIAIIQTLLPALIRSEGRIVNVSSIGGKVAMATYGPYAASKFGLEAVSDALRREVEPLGVNVIVIEPGAVNTRMLGEVAVAGKQVTSGMTHEQRGRYSTLMHATVSRAEAAIPRGVPAEEVGRVIADAITSRRPRTRYTVGREAAIIVRLTRLLSDRMLDSILARSLKPYLP